MKRKRTDNMRLLRTVMVLAIGIVGFGQQRVAAYEIVATVAMIGNVATEIAGRHATVTTLIRTGIDPHLYSPTRNDVQRLQNADVILYVGALLEGRMSSVLDALRRRNPNIHAIIDIVAEKTPRADVVRQFALDPHIWMDVALWQRASEGIAEALIAYDPAHRRAYEENAREYIARLGQLHRYATEAIGSIPASQRILVTAHDAFAYFGRAYGIRVEGIQGISTESEAGIRRINQLLDLVVQRDVDVIFTESSVNDKNARSLIEGARARGHTVRIGGTLYSDAMGEADMYTGTYIGMIDHNVTTIAQALGGNVSPRGMQGRLR